MPSKPSRDLASVILAAGRSTRMKSRTNKVLLPILGKPLIRYQVEAHRAAGVRRVVIIVGFQAEAVMAEIGGEAEYVLQREQKGTGHALLQARDKLRGYGADLDLLVTVGDIPYITGAVLKDLVEAHRRGGAAATIVTAVFNDPPPYGRVLRDASGRVVRIVEEFDATPEEKLIKEVHVSIYAFKTATVLPLLDEIRNDNAKGEYYLTDIIGILTAHGERVETVASRDPRVTLGINTPEDLKEAERYFASLLS